MASQDRKRIREYIAEQNLMAAIELDERIGYSASSLAGQPYKGRNGRVEKCISCACCIPHRSGHKIPVRNNTFHF